MWNYPGNPDGEWLPNILVRVYTLIHSKHDDVTCVPVSPLMIDAHNILVKKKLDKFYVLPIGASTAEVKGVVSAVVHKRSTLGSQKFTKTYTEIKMHHWKCANA